MLSCAILGISCTPNGLKLHSLRSCNYFHPLLVQLSPNCTQKHAISYTGFVNIQPNILIHALNELKVIHSNIYKIILIIDTI